MIRITDRTLSCIDGTDIKRGDIMRFLEYLILTDVDGIELSEAMYNLLSPLPAYPFYVLRLDRPKDSSLYPDIPRFVCQNAGGADGVCAEIYLCEAREPYTTARYADCADVRIQGLDDCLLTDYTQSFAYLKKAFRGEIELCPTNRRFCAGALAAEWVTGGYGKRIVTSFCGVGGFAPTEELIMILRLSRLRKAGKTYGFFPEMEELFRRITGIYIPQNKPVIGKRISYVETGVHVDGILKSPKIYEPFAPDIVGRKRRIILGKKSGKAAVRAKLAELGISHKDRYVPRILARVKALSVKKRGRVTDRELAKIAERYSGDRQ